MKLPDKTTECGIIEPVANSFDGGVYAQPDRYLVKGHLQTRVAFSLILQGKKDQLQQANNWTLGYINNHSPQ
ncbi:hypothetical protein [Calothrix sp. NIES-2098]|uniref:hypothetical protein n=1 Tax=Calothrix sp. NIES-2098 TaxID=1954171 RepID=UPI0030DDDB9A